MDEIWNKSQLLAFFQDCIMFFRGVKCVNYSVLAKLNCTHSCNFSTWYFLWNSTCSGWLCISCPMHLGTIERWRQQQNRVFVVDSMILLFILESTLWCLINIWLTCTEIWTTVYKDHCSGQGRHAFVAAVF